MYDDEWLDGVFSPENLAKLSREEIKRMFLHDIRMFYFIIEQYAEMIVGLEAGNTRDNMHKAMKKNAKSIEKYINHIQSYLKVRQEPAHADDRPPQLVNEKLDRVMLIDELLPLPKEEIKLIFLHEIRMFFSPLEAGLEIVLDFEEDRMKDRDHVIDLMKQKAQQIDMYINHIQSYLKAREAMNSNDSQNLP